MSSRAAVRCIPEYDGIFTPARFNVPELYRNGARRVEYLPFGFDPFLHHPPVPAVSGEVPGADVVFVGTWRPERAAVLEELALRNGDAA